MGNESEMFCFREHKTGGSRLLAVCDADILGKTIKFNDVDFEVCSSFYGEKRADSGQVLDMLERSHVANVVGKKIVDLLVKKELVDKNCVLWMDDVPHVQVLKR